MDVGAGALSACLPRVSDRSVELGVAESRIPAFPKLTDPPPNPAPLFPSVPIRGLGGAAGISATLLHPLVFWSQVNLCACRRAAPALDLAGRAALSFI
jgi:hypothetical protein